MNEFNLRFQKNDDEAKGNLINILVDNPPKEKLLYKFIAGYNGTWDSIRDFSPESSAAWEPKEEGKYTIMVQAKEIDSSKPFNYLSKAEYLVGEYKDNIIRAVYLDRTTASVGDKIHLTVEANDTAVVYRYLIREKEKWELIKNYSADNTLAWTARKSGDYEFLVECKMINSPSNADDFKVVNLKVQEYKKPEINSVRCLNSSILCNEEIIFEIHAESQDNRMILYKFFKIDKEGKIRCIQDYSTKRIVSYIENNSGEYKLLCYAKDMYSQNSYDDRAILAYNVMPYEKIAIETFTSDLSSPQINDREITFRAVVKGGRDLRYRYIIEGPGKIDTGYTCDNQYLWIPKEQGEYNISLFVKDASSSEEFEDSKTINFKIEEGNGIPVRIKEVICDGPTKLLVGEKINIKVIGEGGLDLKYRFFVRKGKNIIERIQYSSVDWVNFIPEEKGSYEIEVQVKDKYSLKEFDSHYLVMVKAMDYIPAQIDYVLMPPKEFHILGDTLKVNLVAQNTQEVLFKYIIKIEGHLVEEVEYSRYHEFLITPRCRGRYIVEVFAKNIKSSKEFDDKKIVKFDVYDALPITNTKIKSSSIDFKVDNAVEFSVESEGGKEVAYEFYLFEQNQWRLVQNYSRKSYYSFMPFKSGSYKVLVLAKSQYRKAGYEDYDTFEFEVN